MTEGERTKSSVDRPLVTVIVATFNRRGTLRRCLDSVLGQEGSRAELIVVDGGSLDGSVSIVREYADHIAWWVSEPDRGIAHAWNKGIAHARGEWLYFLGADDYLLNTQVLAAIVPMLEALPGGQLVAFAPANIVTPTARVVRTLGDRWDRNGFLYCGMNISHQGVFHRRRLFESVGLFDESFRIAMDYELLLRYLRDHEPARLEGFVVAGQELGGLTGGDLHTLSALHEFVLARRKNGLHHSSLTFHVLVGFAWIKRAIRAFLGPRIGPRVIEWGRRMLGRPPLYEK